MARRPLHSSSEENQQTTKISSSKIKKKGLFSRTEVDESVPPRCLRMRSCRYEGSYAYNSKRAMKSINAYTMECVKKTPTKSQIPAEDENTPVDGLSRKPVRIFSRQKKVKVESSLAVQETPSKVLADELTNKLSMSSSKKSVTFSIIQCEKLKMRMKKNLISPKKDAENQEAKKAVSPPKRARHDKNREEVPNKSRSLLDRMKHLLHTCEVPEKLPCREGEYKQVSKFIEECVTKDGYSQTMYICGVPGTGKTATVMQVIRKLRQVYTFKVAFVNAMELTDPKKIYSKIYEDLFPEERKVSANMARRRLNDFLETSDSKIPVIVVIDELDLLCKSRQEFVYDLLNWTEKVTFSLGLIAIANTFDLHERFLARRIISRMGTNRIPFEPYKKDEIEAILTYRLQNCNEVQKDAVELASRKVAAVSGDLRKALDIIRRAVQIAVKEKKTKIGIEIVLKAIRESTSQICIDAVSILSEQSRLVLRASLNFASAADDYFTFSELYETYGKLCISCDMERLPFSSVCNSLMQMCSLRLLIAAPGTNSWSRKLRFGLSVHDIRTALEVVSDVITDDGESDMDIA